MMDQPNFQSQLFETPQEARTSDDYWTPKWVFDAIGLTFDLDVACPPEGPAHTPCHAYYTQADNGLTSPWHGTVWMNPPFSQTTPWATKFIDHADGIALVPFSKSRWFEHLWNEAEAMVYLPSSLKFVQGSIFMPVVLASMGSRATTALTNANINRVR